MSGTVGPRLESVFNRFSFEFDGTDDFVNIGTTSLGITTAISISAWVKIPTTNTGGGGSDIQEIICEDTTSGTNRNWALNWRGGSLNRFQFAIFHTNGSVTAIQSTGIVPNDNQWHHVMGVFDGTTNTNGLKLYVDGNLFQTTAGSTGIRSTSAVEATIGALTGGGTWRLEGTVDEVAVWDSAINISDVWNGSGVPFDISSSNPLSWWRMGEAATYSNPGGLGNWTLTDQGSGGNDGTSNSMDETNRVLDTP